MVLFLLFPVFCVVQHDFFMFSFADVHDLFMFCDSLSIIICLLFRLVRHYSSCLVWNSEHKFGIRVGVGISRKVGMIYGPNCGVLKGLE